MRMRRTMAPGLVPCVMVRSRVDQTKIAIQHGTLMTLEEIFDIAKTKRYLIVSTVNESGAPEAALMGFVWTQANEVVFDTLASSRKAVNLARNDAAALVIGWGG